jgi:hypothetical protein
LIRVIKSSSTGSGPVNGFELKHQRSDRAINRLPKLIPPFTVAQTEGFSTR